MSDTIFKYGEIVFIYALNGFNCHCYQVLALPMNILKP